MMVTGSTVGMPYLSLTSEASSGDTQTTGIEIAVPSRKLCRVSREGSPIDTATKPPIRPSR